VTHALAPRIAQGRPKNQPYLNRQLRRWLSKELQGLVPEIAAVADRFGTDRYRKHFSSLAHLCLLLFHGLSGSGSLRQSYAAFPACKGLLALSQLAEPEDPTGESLSVSYSQFAESNSSRPALFLAGLVPFLIGRVRRLDPANPHLPSGLHLLDTTFLRLSLLLAPWLPNKGGPDVAKVRLQLQYDPQADLPEHVTITDTRLSDQKGLEQEILDDPQRLAELQGHTLIVDLGFYSHCRFARLLSSGVHLVTRLHPLAALRLQAELPVAQPLPTLEDRRIQVISDQRVSVGSLNNNGPVLDGMRLVTACVSPSPKAKGKRAKAILYRLLTDRFDLTSTEVVQLYLWRWQIELFFRWLKSHLHLPRLLGYSRNAVELSVYLGLVVHLLTLLASHALGFGRRSPALLAQMVWVLATLCPCDQPDPEPRQLPLPYILSPT
jgi:hypothetical protein